MKGSRDSNEAIFQTIFRVLLFSKEVFEPIKFTNYYDVKCSSNKMVLYSDVASEMLVNQGMKKQP